jgi:RNA polymerase sigma-54 factor
MKPTLQVRLSQHLALTPQLQQSIRLLQLSTLELQQEVEQMLGDNPFLELDGDDETDPRGFDLATAAPSPPAATAADDEAYARGDEAYAADTPPIDGDRALDQQDYGTTEREDWANGTEGDDFDGIRETRATSNDPDHEAPDAGERMGEGPTLVEHLRAQMLGLRLEPEDALALSLLIDSLDDDGYLADPLEEIVQRLAVDLAVEDAAQREDLESRLRCALKFLQSMDPSGVGARDLPECLVLQLRSRPRSQAKAIAIIVAKNHLDLLAKRDWRKLAAATGADEDLLKEAHSLIVACEPKPGRPFARTEQLVVVPDVVVRKAGRGFRVMLNPDVMPKLRINDFYAQAMRGGKGSDKPNGALGGQLQEARWFIKNIKQRFDTILRVSSAIVERQKGFFTHGEIAMRPLVLREIADELGLHESTISRVTTAKYMSTPYGTFELKYFFGSALATETGGNASSTAVRALIKQFVGAEDTAKPLSDNQLATMLAEQGIQVARRTVAKYREALRIAPANLRKTD